MLLTAQTSCFDMSIAPYVSPKVFQFSFLSWKPCLFLLESRLEFVIHRGKPKFISLPVKFPADRSKFQFCTTTTRSKLIRIFTRTVLPCLCFLSKSSGRNNAKYAFQYSFKDNTAQYAKKEEEEKKEQSRDLHDDIRGGLPIQFLTPPDKA